MQKNQNTNHAFSNGQQAARRIQCIGHYDLDKTIGQGQFGKVKLATHVLTGERVAVKIIMKAKLDEETLRKVYREVRIMKLLNHPNIIKLYEVIETEKVLFLVMEYASGGEVLDFIVAHGRLTETQARKFFQQIVSAVDYCHKHHVIHRDIKCENLLLDGDLNIKIIDFGLSNCFTPGGKMQTFCGSPTYCAPELIQRHKYEGPEIDVWSLGVVLFVLVCGYLPFDAKDFQTLFRKILSGNYHIPEYVSEDCASVISSMLMGEPEERATLLEVAKHHWMQMDYKQLEVTNFGIEGEEVQRNGEVDVDVIHQMVTMGFSPEVVRESLAQDKYDVAASTYYLLLARKLKNKGILEPLLDSHKLHTSKDTQPQTGQTPTGVSRGGRGHRRHHTEGVIQNAAPAAITHPMVEQPKPAPTTTVSLRVSSPDSSKQKAPSPPSPSHPPAITINKPVKPPAPTSPPSIPRSTSHGHHLSPGPAAPTAPSSTSTTTTTSTSSSSGGGNEGALTQFWRVQKTHKRARSVDHHQDALFENPGPAIPTTTSSRRDDSPTKKNVYQQRARQAIPTTQNSMRGSRRRPSRPRSIEPNCTNLIEASHHPTPSPPHHHHGLENGFEDTAVAQKEAPLSPRRLTADTFTPPTQLELSAVKATSTSTTTTTTQDDGDSSDSSQDNAEGGDTPKQSRPKREHRRTQSLGTERVPEKLETQNVIDEYSNKLYPPAPKSPRQSSLNAFMTSFRNAIGLMKKDTKPAPEPRTTRFALNVSMTSAKSAEDIMAEVVRVLNEHSIQYAPSPGQQFEVVCKYKYNEDESLIFEIEICKLPMLSMNGLRLNRISGDAWVYKKVAAELIEEMEL